MLDADGRPPPAAARMLRARRSQGRRPLDTSPMGMSTAIAKGCGAADCRGRCHPNQSRTSRQAGKIADQTRGPAMVTAHHPARQPSMPTTHESGGFSGHCEKGLRKLREEIGMAFAFH